MTIPLLLAEAEPATLGFLERHLPGDGFELVRDGRRPDLVLLGGLQGLDRWRGEAPVIVIGDAGNDAVDRVQAFRRGVDDYVPRPFDYAELVERIRAVLRRVRPPEPDELEAGPIRVDLRTRDVRLGGRRVLLAAKEYELLVHLARDPRRVFTKAELLRDVWGYQASARTRTLDSHASRLRRKLRELDPLTTLLENVWGVGYRLLGTEAEE